MPRRHHQQCSEVSHVSGGCSGCEAVMSENRVLRRRVEVLQRQLRATANLQALLAAKDRELAACRTRLQERRGRETTCSDADVEEHDEAVVITPARERRISK